MLARTLLFGRVHLTGLGCALAFSGGIGGAFDVSHESSDLPDLREAALWHTEE